MSDETKKPSSSWTTTLWAILGGYIAYQYFTHGTLPFNAHTWLLGFESRPTVAATQAPPREVLRFTATELFNAYHANEVATDLRLKNKEVIVVGRVASINKNVWNSIYVSLQTPNQFMSANMNLDTTQTDEAAALRKGQQVEIRCKSMNLWVGSPTGNECRLLSAQ
jgi:hypothetical protein